jgi:hypothetical protein
MRPIDPFDFQWESKQRTRMEDLIREVDRLKRISPATADKEEELERLRFDVSELKLLVGVIVRILESKGLTSPTEFIEMTETIAHELRG